MKVDIQGHGTVAVLVPHGPLTLDELDEFRGTMKTTLTDKQGRVVVNMSDVPYLDSAGIELLLEIGNDADGVARPRFALLADAAREALDLTNVLNSLDVFDTVENAIRSYKR